MRCLMCERKYSDEQGETLSGFCSEECRNVYARLNEFEERGKAEVV